MTSHVVEKDLTEQKHLEQHSPMLSPQDTGNDMHQMQLPGRGRLSDLFNFHEMIKKGWGGRGSATVELLN